MSILRDLCIKICRIVKKCIEACTAGKRENPSHKIHIEKDSFLYKSLGDEAMVNSFHHQAIKDLAPNFKVSAKSSDGIIEAIEHESFPIYAVQFHPEAMSHKYGEMQAIFNEFLKNCEVK